MDDGGITSCIIILALLCLAAYFAVCETAFASVNKIRIKTLAERGDGRAKRAASVLADFNRAISTLLIGTNIVHIVMASYVTVLVTRRWGVSFVTLSTVITTVVVFFAGEMLPKSVGKKYSERFALATAGSLCFFMRIFTPASAVLTAIGNAAARLTKGDSEVSVTEDELYDIIETMTDEGELEQEQGELVHSALTFGELTAENIVTVRMDLTALEAGTPVDETLELIRDCKHSRIPVYEGSIDNIIGILQIRRYIKTYLTDGADIDLRSLLDEPYFVHSSTKIDELLQNLSVRKYNMAVVTDNYGGTLGIVTVEDILEELVGEIWDEDDEVVEPCVRNADGSFTFEASVDIEDAFEFMDYEDPDEFDFDHILLGQWAYEQLGEIPEGGESFEYNGLRVTVTEAENRRIRKLRIERLPEPEPEAEGGEDR